MKLANVQAAVLAIAATWGGLTGTPAAPPPPLQPRR